MLDEISKSSKNDFIISYRLFSQMATPFNKTDINSKIYRKYAFDDSYKKTLNKHVLNNLTENTKLTVYNTYIKIKTNKNITDFFKVLENEENILKSFTIRGRILWHLCQFVVFLLFELTKFVCSACDILQKLYFARHICQI